MGQNIYMTPFRRPSLNNKRHTSRVQRYPHTRTYRGREKERRTLAHTHADTTRFYRHLLEHCHMSRPSEHACALGMHVCVYSLGQKSAGVNR